MQGLLPTRSTGWQQEGSKKQKLRWYLATFFLPLAIPDSEPNIALDKTRAARWELLRPNHHTLGNIIGCTLEAKERTRLEEH